MVNGRNSFTYIANIFVLTLSLILFVLIADSPTCFSVLCITCLGLGGVATVWYIINIKETYLSRMALELEARYRKELAKNEVDAYEELLSKTEIEDPRTNLTEICAKEELVREMNDNNRVSTNASRLVYSENGGANLDEDIKAQVKEAVAL
jgi:hypothetical protein